MSVVPERMLSVAPVTIAMSIADSFAIRRNEVDLTVGTNQTYVQVGYLRLNRDISPTIACPREKPVSISGKDVRRTLQEGKEVDPRIMRLLLSSHPEGLVVTEIQEELEIPNSTLSHHLEKLKTEGLVRVQRESTFLRYTANTEALQELLQFPYAECCTRNKAVRPQDIVQICK